MFEIPMEKLIGNKAKELFSADDVKLHRDLEVLNKEEKGYRIEIKAVTYLKNPIWIELNTTPIIDDNGELIQVEVINNITERKIGEQKIKQLSLVAEKTNNGILIADKDGKAVWANQGYLNMFEIRDEDLIGKYPRELFKPNDKEFHEEMNILNGSTFSLEVEATTFLKKKLWVELSSTPILNEKGEVVQQIEVLTDITDKVKARDEIKRYSLELEFQNKVKEKLINATTFEEITKEALGVVLDNIQNCVHIALLMLDEKKQNLSGYYLKDGAIFKERFNVKDTKSFETIKSGACFIENNLEQYENNSVSDKDVVELGVLSYIVLPIISFDELIGSLNIGFDCQFKLTATEIKNLESFSVLLSTALNQLNLQSTLADKDRDHVSSLMYAKNIQNTILPKSNGFSFPLYDVNVIFKPRDIVSGDFYWSKDTEEYTFIAVADCTGHGVPGAFLTLIGSRILEQIIITDKISSPAEILNRLDDQLFASLNSAGESLVRDGMEIALCAISKTSNLLTFAGAGMGLLYFLNDQNTHIKGQRKAIGDYRQDDFSFENHQIQLTGDEIFFMATDGYQDQLGGDNYKRFSKNKMVELLDKIKTSRAEERNTELTNELALHLKHYNQTDDVTVIGFRINNK